MKRSLIPSEQGLSWLKTLLVLLFLAAILWVARYWHFRDFGLYEDDLTEIPKVMAMTGREYFQLLMDDLLDLHPHGRPLHNSFIYTFTFLGSGESFQDLYLFGFIIGSINVFLFYGLLKRLFDDSFALIGGIAFTLFSADTTQAFLTHSFALRISLIFLLLALHSYLSRRRWLAYLFAILILFTYETPFFVILAAPLLSVPWDRKLLKELIVNGFSLFVIIGCVYIFRSVIGDYRMVGVSFPEIVTTPVLHMIQGPIVSMGTYLYRPFQALLSLTFEILSASVVAFIIFNLVLTRFLPDWREVKYFFGNFDRKSIRIILRERKVPFEIPGPLVTLFKLLLVGGVMLVLAYPLTFTIRAYAISGRDTRVHAAAAIGASILWACIGWLLLTVGEIINKRRIIVVLFSGLFALILGFGFIIQEEYVNAWVYQKAFWTELLPLIQDVDEGDIILVEPDGLKDTQQIAANTWNLRRVLDQIYAFPPEWEEPPRVYRLAPWWREVDAGGDGLFAVNKSTVLAPGPQPRVVPCTDVILIETSSGSMTRRMEPMDIHGESYCWKAILTTYAQYDKNILYKFLIQE